MAKKAEVKDPTLPTADVMIGGASYKVCLDLNALFESEGELIRQGHNAALLESLGNIFGSGDAVKRVFAVAVQRFHPELGFESAYKLPNLAEVYRLRGVLSELWKDSMPEPKEETGDRP